MNKQQIQEAIARAQDGINQYIEIMEMLHRVDVSQSEEFQGLYNHYYEINVARRPAEWRQIYYQILEREKNNLDINFDDVLNQLSCIDEQCNFSFTSKLIATINPDKPTLDTHILRNTGHRRPQSNNLEGRIAEANLLYRCIQNWYDNFLQSAKGITYGIIFDMKVPNRHYNKANHGQVEFTELKKVDFILWQHRMPDYEQMDYNH